jgi:hypothetical protein
VGDEQSYRITFQCLVIDDQGGVVHNDSSGIVMVIRVPPSSDIRSMVNVALPPVNIDSMSLT